MNLLYALTLTTMTSFSGASISPEVVAETYPLVYRSSCTDDESGRAGTCYLYRAAPDEHYMVFIINGSPVFVRHVRTGSPYSTVWLAPVGTSL